MSVEFEKRLLGNTFALAFPNMVKPFVSLILVYVISRRLGVEGLGEYSLLSSYVSMFTTAASLGIGGLLVREVSQRLDEIHALIPNSVMLGLFSSIIAAILMDCSVIIMGYDHDLMVAIVIGSISLLPGNCLYFFQTAFRSLEKSGYIAFAHCIETLLKAIGCIAVVFMGYGIVAISSMTVLSKLVSVGLLVACYMRVVGEFSLSLRTDVWKMLLKQAPTFIGITIFSVIYVNVDIIFLSKLAGVSSVGIYDAASRIIQACVVLPLALSMAVLPVFSRDVISGFENLRDKIHKSVHYVMVLFVPTVIGLIILADKLILLIYGEQFEQSIFILQLIAPSMIPYSLALIFSQALLASNSQHVDLAVHICAAIVATALNYFLILQFLEIGAAIARIVTTFSFMALQVLFISSYMLNTEVLRLATKPLLASICMAPVTYTLHDYNILVNYVFSTTVYFLLLFLMKGLYAEEEKIIRKALKKIGFRH